MSDLTENQKQCLVEAYKRWGSKPLTLDPKWDSKITKQELEELIDKRYFVNVVRIANGIECNISIKAQELAASVLQNTN